jgi:preprotein translocase subunit SecG
MFILLSVFHVLIALGLILIVLMQSGKGADIGAAFGGGSSQTVFGGRGASTFLSKMTTVFAVLFMLNSLTLTILASHRGSASVIGENRPAQTQPAPAAPSPAPPAPASQGPSGQAPAAPQAPKK